MKPRVGSDSDLNYCCFLLTEIAHMTNNSLVDVIKHFKRKDLEGLYDSAEVFHCENPASVADRYIDYLKISHGKFIHTKEPNAIDFGFVLGRLIFDLKTDGYFEDYITGLITVLSDYSFMSKLENPDTGLYWQQSGCVLDYYLYKDLSWLE